MYLYRSTQFVSGPQHIGRLTAPILDRLADAELQHGHTARAEHLARVGRLHAGGRAMMCPPHLQDAYQRAVAANAPLLALLQGCIDGRHELAILGYPCLPWPGRIAKTPVPYATLIGDDPYPNGVSRGPEGWACARGAKRWANAVIVHGTGPAYEHYRTASLATLLSRRVLFVETDSSHVDAWAQYLECSNTLVFRPPEGRVHPSRGGETVH